jgi:hypothetical protein
VQQQGWGAAQIDHARFRQQAQARFRGKGGAQQEIAVAVDKVAGHARGVELPRVPGECPERRRGVVADPVPEQIAEDVNRLGLPGGPDRKPTTTARLPGGCLRGAGRR